MKVKSLRWLLIQYDQSSYKKEEIRTRTHTEERSCEEGKGGHLQARQRGLRRHLSCKCLDLGLLASIIVQK